MPAIVRGYEWSTHDHGIAQNSRKAQQNGPVAHLTDRNKRTTDTISSHRTVRRKAHRLLGQKIDLRYPRANWADHAGQARASWIGISLKSRGCWPTAPRNASLQSATVRQRVISTIGCKNVVSNASQSNPPMPMAVYVPLCGFTHRPG